ncbi:hypothetical protein ACOME3_005639 [Neoechinorhynchus agilis]
MKFLPILNALLVLIIGFDFCYGNAVQNGWSIQYQKYDGVYIVCPNIKSSKSLSSVLNSIETNGSINRIKIEFAFFYDIVSSNDHIFPSVSDVSIYCKRNEDAIITITKSLIRKFRHSRRLEIQNARFGYIEDDAFQGFYNLNHLDLSENNLWRLGINMHVDLYNLQSLHLSNNGLSNDCLNVIKRMKMLKTLDLTNNLIKRFVLTNQFNFYRLENIRINDNNLNEINMSQLAKLKNLKTLQFSYQQDLNELFKDEFQFEKLKEFTVYGGIAHYVDSTFITRMPEINLVEILRSNLEEVPRGNNRTETLILRGNRLKIIHQNSFYSWTNVIKLDVSWNRISQISKNAFSLLKRLEILNLGHNKLHSLPSEILQNNKLLRQLILTETNLIVLTNGIFKNVKNLRHLDVSDNFITGINTDSMASKTIDYCLLKNNPINVLIYNNSELTDTILTLRHLAKYMPEPTRLAANVNDMITFYNYTANSTLHLTGKKLTQIQDVILFIVPNTFSLDLSHNEISEITYDDFEGLRALEFLCLQFNRIHKIAPRAFRNIPRLKTLDLANNQLKDIDVFHLFYGLDQLIFLHMANNGFSLFPSHHLSDLSNLQSLNISSNPIHEFYSKPFKIHQSVNIIGLYNTSIKIFNGYVWFEDINKEMSYLIV